MHAVQSLARLWLGRKGLTVLGYQAQRVGRLWLRSGPVCLLLVGSALGQEAEWAVDRTRSQIVYRGSHPAHSWEGVSRDVRGSIRFDPARPNGMQVRIWAPVESFSSGNDNRDSNMLDVLEADRYPEVRFVSDSASVLFWDGRRGRWRLAGQLDFHGRRRLLVVSVEMTFEDAATLRATGAFRISLREFEVRRPRLLLVPIRDELDIRFEILLRRSGP